MSPSAMTARADGRGQGKELWLLCAPAETRPVAELVRAFAAERPASVLGPTRGAVHELARALAAGLGVPCSARIELDVERGPSALASGERAWPALAQALAAAGARALLVAEAELVCALTARALDLAPERARALAVDPGRLVLLRDDPGGLVLRHANVLAPEARAGGTALPGLGSAEGGRG